MPAAPARGDAFDQERAPGIAEDHSRIVDSGLSVTVPAGSFTGCVKTEDVNPLDEGAGIENKFYCPGIGLVREAADGVLLELTSVARSAGPAPGAPSDAPVAAPPVLGTGGDTGDRLPWLLAAGVAAVIGVAAAVLVARRKRA
jgi:LPXTG-motif cell wall-anchored protein